jgi:hypothetical protein
MAKSLQILLAQTDDAELCDGVFDLVVAYHGEDIDASAISEAERVVLLVWHASGIIGNGGFRYLFEGNIKGDPYFALTAEAFQAAGCKKAAEAVQETLALFPQSRPQKDIQARLRHYLSRIKAYPTDMDMQFFAAKHDLRKCLADYIRSHDFAFKHLDHPKAKRSPERPRPPEKPPRRKRKTRSPLADLPHWARVAFAARCARAVLPLLSRHWPAAPAKHSRAVRLAIELAEQSAEEGRPVEGLKEAVINATIVAGAALSAGSEFNPKEPPPENALEGTIASFVAKAAEFTARAAKADPRESLSNASEALTWAKSAMDSADEEGVADAQKEDFANHQRAAIRGKWTDETRIPSEIWSML